MMAAVHTSLPPLARPVIALPGVGPERAAQLAKLEIRTVEELLLHRPRRYEDRHHLLPIAQLERGEPVSVKGKVVAAGVKWFKHHSKSVCEVVLNDGTARLHCRWWNLPYMEKYFAVGDEVLAFGRPVGLKPRTMDHPETEVLEGGEESFIHLNRLTPIYPLTEGLPQRWLRALVWRTLQACGSQIPEPWPALSNLKVDGAGGSGAFPTRAQAVRLLHFPDSAEQPEAARRRLALDEFIVLQREIQIRRHNLQTKAQARPCAGNNRLIRPFLGRLGFKLTDAQTRVLRELRLDLAGPHPMRRLLQGDVGSGKTVVAACCALMALESGFNVALMAPTEVLAQQHFRTFFRWFQPLGLAVHLQTGSYKGGLAVGKSRALFIGTHALIQAGVELENLGLVIIDEQHKFGVAQREQLVRKGQYPHLLVMTATPIPRTLGLTLYGELDVSVIDQLPPGRGQVQTFVRTIDKLPQVWEFVRSRLAAGQQAYIVYPRVEDTAADGVKAVVREFEQVRQKLAPYPVALLHGRLRAAEKEQALRKFLGGQARVLLATSLIEVGLDVPKATLMLVENAELFGLAQLHQLRGRIGRGAQNSYCILVAAARTPEARQRLQVLEQTTDGFQIAEADLKLRGPGELLGQQQSGIPQFRFGDLAQDLELIELARRVAAEFLHQKSGGQRSEVRP
jgi:ATP-dependent DNA helicase RecG